jgi:hypothetical protein
VLSIPVLTRKAATTAIANNARSVDFEALNGSNVDGDGVEL